MVRAGDSERLHAEVASVLDWWTMAGVDLAVGERTRNWLRPMPAAPEPAVDTAPSVAALPDTLDAFLAWLATVDDPLLGPVAQRVSPAGNRAPDLMILADMPGGEDAAAGRLFDGPVARLFDRMLAAIGTTREAVWLAPLFPARPAGGSADAGRVAALGEIARHHVALVRPRRLLLMGKCAGEALIGEGTVRGRVHSLTFLNFQVATVASFNPNALLDSATLKPAAWADLRLLGDMS